MRPGYYGTALHELSHWTGHPSRLNRSTLNESYRFGDPAYAREELRAELASLFVAAETGIPHDPASHAAYVGSWVEALRKDKNEIFRAAHDASAAADFVLSLDRERANNRGTENANPNPSGKPAGLPRAWNPAPERWPFTTSVSATITIRLLIRQRTLQADGRRYRNSNRERAQRILPGGTRSRHQGTGPGSPNFCGSNA